MMKSGIVALAAGLLSATAAYAQVIDPQALLACDSLKDDMSRLKCFSDVVSALKKAPDQVQDNHNALSSDPQGDASAPSIEVVPAATPVVTPKNEDYGLSEFQKETLAKQRGEVYESETAHVRVVHLNKLATKKYVFILENGQIWKETSSSVRIMPKGEFDAVIAKGAIGGFQLKIEGVAGFVRVQRLK